MSKGTQLVPADQPPMKIVKSGGVNHYYISNSGSSTSTSPVTSNSVTYSTTSDVLTWNDCTTFKAVTVLQEDDDIAIDHRRKRLYKLWEKYNCFYVLNKDAKYELPDGTELIIDKDGNYTFKKNRKVIYRANPFRDFNPYVNASDLLEEFIKFCGEEDVSQQEFLKLPLELFIAWMVTRAAEKDGDEPDPMEKAILHNGMAKLAPPSKPKCFHCGRFISMDKFRMGMNFCNGDHMDRHLVRSGAAM